MSRLRDKVSNEVVIKKVSPYPIDAVVAKNGATRPGRIVRITQNGFLLETDEIYMVGKVYEVQFQLPAFRSALQVSAKVVKSYNRMVMASAEVPSSGEATTKPDSSTKSGLKSEKLVEMHFVSLSDLQNEAIYKFLRATKQVGQ